MRITNLLCPFTFRFDTLNANQETSLHNDKQRLYLGSMFFKEALTFRHIRSGKLKVISDDID